MGRRFGQHFLVNQSVLQRIAEAACPSPDLTVVEIGAGKGALTGHLLERAARVIALEIDQVLVQYLQSRFRGDPKLEILEADVLQTDLAQWGPVAIAGNLPYYITSPITAQVLTLEAHLKSAVFLVQKEVAERMASGPGSRDYGYLSVQTQFYSRPELLFTVPASAFRPPPKVESAVVRLAPHIFSTDVDAAAFLRFASLCFRHKRKTLRNNLASVYPKPVLDALPVSAKRAEQMSLPDLLTLFRRLDSLS